MRKVEDTKGLIRSHKSKKDRQYNGKRRQKYKQYSTKHYTENYRLIEQHEPHKKIRMNSGLMDG